MIEGCYWRDSTQDIGEIFISELKDFRIDLNDSQ